MSVKNQKIICLVVFIIVILGLILTTLLHNRNKSQSEMIVQKNNSQISSVANGNAWSMFTTAQKEAKLKTLTSTQYKVTQEGATEIPFKNLYAENTAPGIYVDIISDEPLYLSTDKFDSGTGWPSFVKPVSGDAITLRQDDGLVTARTEVRSKIADSHLGHVFNDGPVERGGLRYCMNSAALRFVPLADMEKEGYGAYVNMVK